MQNGTTYSVHPFMLLRNFSRSSAFISAGAFQLFVGPACPRRRVQMNVRSSTRATSDGAERARKQFGRFSGFSGIKVPFCTSSWQSAAFSSSDPSHQCTASGWQRALISSTQERTSG
jgi:hypothetical protein